MTEPGWYAQPFRADGGITARGLLGQLGRPSLSRLTMVVREAAQNSWDARQVGLPVIRFRLDLSTVGAGHAAAWRETFSHAADSPSADGIFRSVTHASTIRYLAISDRGTTGLSGPTRSDTGPTKNQQWARFVLNSGDRDGVSGGSSGGTFGYGKGALFQMSKVGSVLVYTRFKDSAARLRTRFIVVTIRESFYDGESRYTGRHWWGLPETGHCEPLRDDQADKTARDLGIPGFVGGETGTTLVVVDPDMADPSLPESDSTPELSVPEAGAYLAGAAAWNLWPIMLPERSQRMAVAVTANGVDIAVPDAESDPSLAFFASAYRKISSGSGEALACGRPKKDLGQFAHTFTFGAEVSSPAARELGLEGAPRHICLMRSPELVVRYHQGPERANPAAGYAGVFKVARELDTTFARSEPPTHDAWEHQQLQRPDATFVRTTETRLKERCDVLSGIQARRSVDVGNYAMGSVAHRLGHLLAGPGGTGAAVLVTDSRPGTSRTVVPTNAVPTGRSPFAEPTDASGPARSKSQRPKLVDTPHFEILDGIPVAVQRVQLHGPDRVEALVRVLTGDGGTENTSPTGAQQPQVLGWHIPGTDRMVSGDVLYHSGAAVEVELIVTAVADVLVDINVVGRS